MKRNILILFVALLISTSLSGCADSFVVTQSICDITSEICYYSESICNLVNTKKIENSNLEFDEDLQDISETMKLQKAKIESYNSDLTEEELQELKLELVNVKEKLLRVYKRAHKLE